MRIALGVSLVICILLAVCQKPSSVNPPPTDGPKPPISTPLPSPISRVCFGKPVSSNLKSFLVAQHYVPSGVIGDVGDVTLGAIRFKYDIQGKGPHEYEYKYMDDSITTSPIPAKFGGVVWLSPPSKFGTECDGGYDLRGFRRIKWKARSLGEPVKVEFFIGGITWIWKQEGIHWVQSPAPYPDTMPRRGLGIKTLSSELQQFDEALSDVPEDKFRRVVGGFGWTATWADNNIVADESGKKPRARKSLEFEVQDITYEKE